MSNELPPLPEARRPDENGAGWFTAGQLQAYARAAVADERERCAKVCEAEADICDAQDDDQHAWTLREAAKLIRKG